MSLALRYAARSHTGLLRTGNEDSLYAGPRLLAVADGMGGHAAGEVASAVAVAALAPLDEDAPGSDLLDALRRSAMMANAHLRDMIVGDAALDGMGTTLVAVLFAGSRLGLLHVGDSRCYLLRDGELTQITHDHTLVQALVDEGRITEEEAGTHPRRSMITRAMDGRDGLELDLSVREARIGDRYLLCSDGLTGPVSSRDTLQEALQIADPQEAVDQLVALALRGGGPDNVSVIVADIVDGHPPSADTPVIAGAAAEAPQPPPPGVADTAAARARTAEGRDQPVTGPVAYSSPEPTQGRRRRVALSAVAGGGLLVAALVAALVGWGYVQGQYYVGVDRDQVAVFRGVAGQVAGVRLSSVEERTAVVAASLPEMNAEQVREGIVAQDRGHAEQIVARLSELACAAPASPPPPSSATTTPEAIAPAIPTQVAAAPSVQPPGVQGPGPVTAQASVRATAPSAAVTAAACPS